MQHASSHDIRSPVQLTAGMLLRTEPFMSASAWVTMLRDATRELGGVVLSEAGTHPQCERCAGLGWVAAPGSGAESLCPSCDGIGVLVTRRRPGYVEIDPARALTCAGLPAAMRTWTLDTYLARIGIGEDSHADAFRAAIALLEGKGPRGLYLSGGAGVGKTGLAVGVLAALAGKLTRIRFVDWPRFVADCRSTMDNSDPRRDMDLVADLVYADLVVIDDLGVGGRWTEYTSALAYQVVDGLLYRGHGRAVVTSNLDLESLGREADGRIASRLRELCAAVVLTGADVRG